jgi:hypothetical protein
MHRLVSRNGRLLQPALAGQQELAMEQPLVSFRVIRSFAHQSERESRLKLAESTDSLPASGSAAEGAVKGGACVAARGGILSFRDVSLQLGPLDFTAHESFLTAVFSFVMQLPLQDIWQVCHCVRLLCSTRIAGHVQAILSRRDALAAGTRPGIARTHVLVRYTKTAGNEHYAGHQQAARACACVRVCTETGWSKQTSDRNREKAATLNTQSL